MLRSAALLLSGALLGGGLVIMADQPNDQPPHDRAIDVQPVHGRTPVDLSHTISTDIPLWPGDPAVEFTELASFPDDGYYLRSFSIGEHSATHMNAPNSFHADGVGIDAYEPKDLVKKAVVIDVRRQAADDADYTFGRDDLRAWERRHGRVPRDSVVLLNTGWSKKWSDPDAFMGQDADGGLHFPGFDGETTKYLLRERKIAGVGIDTHGVDPGQDTSFTTNTSVLAEKRIVLECLTNLDRLPATGTTLHISPLKLKDGSGSPATVTAYPRR